MENNPAAPRPSYCPEPAFVVWHARKVFEEEVGEIYRRVDLN